MSRGQAPVITTVSSPIPHSSSFSPARSNGAVDYSSPAPCSAQSFRLGKSTASLHHQRNRLFAQFLPLCIIHTVFNAPSSQNKDYKKIHVAPIICKISEIRRQVGLKGSSLLPDDDDDDDTL